MQLQGIYELKLLIDQAGAQLDTKFIPRIDLRKDDVPNYALTNDPPKHTEYRIFGEYRLVGENRIELCGRFRSGEYELPQGHAPRLNLRNQNSNGGWVNYVYERSDIRGPSHIQRAADVLLRCGTGSKVSPLQERLALAASGALFAGFQSNVGRRRVAQGELYLAANLGSAGTVEDYKLWLCVVKQGVTIVEFVAPSLSSEQAYVWPDGGFLAALQGGATYGWWLRSSGCGMPERQYSGRSLTAPLEPASQEKIVLGCMVAGGLFKDCRAYWLQHP